MTRKPNFAKCILGVAVLALLFIGTMAVTRAPRTRAAKLAPAVAAKLTTSTASIEALPVPTPVATPISVVNNGLFELDGNISLDGFGDDWINLNCPAATPTPQAVTATGVVPYDGKNFTQGGSKDRLDINASTTATNWLWTQSNVPDKTLISNAYAAQYLAPKSDGTSDTLLYVGGDRFSNNGDAFIGVWFFQAPVFTVPNSPGTFRSGPTTSDPLAQHTFGDVLILADFTGGGAVASPKVFKWVAPCTDNSTAFGGTLTGNCPIAGLAKGGAIVSNCQKGATLCDITPPASNTGPILTEGLSNASLLTIPTGCQTTWQFTSKTGTPTGTIDLNEFFEVGINLSALGLGGECFPTFEVETRSSQDVDAQLKAFVLHSFENCGISCEKSVAPQIVCFGTDVTYTYGADNPFPVALTATIRDDDGTPNDTTDDVYISGLGPPVGGVFPVCTVTAASPTPSPIPSSNVPAGTQTGQLGCTRTISNLPVTPAAGLTNTSHTVATTPTGTVLTECTATATVIVNPNPTAAAGSNQTASCVTAATTAFTLSGTSTNGTGVWSVVSGPAVINSQSQVGNAVGASVTFTGTGSAVLRLTTTSSFTPSCGTPHSDLTLTVTPAVGVSIAHITTCDLSGATTLTLTAATTGGTAPIGFSWSSGETTASISKGPGTYTVTVTDANGCMASATRKIGLCGD